MRYYVHIFVLIILNISGNLCEKENKGIVHEEYLLMIEPYFNNMTFRGEVSITFSVINATTQIYMSAERLKHENITLRSSDASKTTLINVGFLESEGNWLLFTVEKLIGRYTLNVSFSGVINDVKESKGLFYNTYIDNEIDKTYAVCETWTKRPYRLFPYFDQPFLKTPFTLLIARDPLNFTLCSMQMQDTSLQKDLSRGNKLWDKYHSPNISVNEVGFIIHGLSNVTIKNYTLFSKFEAMDQTNFSLSLMKTIVELANKMIPQIVFKHLNIVALPDGFSQMTFHPGFVICREDKILYKETVSNTKSQQKVEESVVHIIVKQLLLELKTEEKIFSEGLVSFLEDKILSQMNSSRKSSGTLNTHELQPESEDNSKDSTMNSHKRVAGVLRMILDELSTEELLKVLSHMLTERKPVTSENFFSSLAQQYGKGNLPSNYSYQAVLQAWLNQQGQPLISVTMDEASIIINQTSPTGANTTWPIQLRFKTDLDSNVENETLPHRVWLVDYSLHVPKEPKVLSKWIVFHTQGSCRVNYNHTLWQALTDQLMTNHSVFPWYARCRLIDDIFHLAEGGLINYTQVFRLTQYLKNETDYRTWRVAVFNFDRLIKLFHGTPLASDIQEYVKSLYSPYFEQVYRIMPLDRTRTKRISSSEALLWGCHWKLESCLLFTSELFKQWQSVSRRFPPDYKEAALCTGVRQYPKVFMEVFDAFTQSVVEGDRLLFLKSMACTKYTSHINFLLELVFADSNQAMIGYHNKLQLIEYLVNYPDNLKEIIRFLEKNYATAVTVVGSQMMSSVWAAIERNMYSREGALLIKSMAVNSSLPLSLRERLGMILVKVDNTEKQSSQLAPQVSEALGCYWTVTANNAPSKNPLQSFGFPFLLYLVFYLLDSFYFL